MSDTPRRSIHALACSWPYRAAPFGPPLVELIRSGPRKLDDSTAGLREAMQQHIQRLAAGHSMAQLDAIVEQAWFGRGADRVRLVAHLDELAARMLECHGPTLRLAGVAPDERARHADAWRRLSLYMPADLLIAAASEGDPACDHVQLLDPLLAKLLDDRVAETHLHAGAGLDFGVLWQAIRHDLTWALPRRDYDDAGDGLGGGRDHARVLRAAFIARHLLFMFAWHRSEGEPRDFVGFLRAWLPQLAGTRRGRAVLPDALAQTWGLLHLGPVSEAHPGALRQAMCALSGARPKVRRVNDLLSSDPVARWLPPGPGRASPELRLLQRCLTYLRGEGRDDLRFAEVFWQYVRVRTLVFGRLVEAPGTAGLDWFSRHYQRLRHYRGVLDGRLAESSVAVLGRGVGLRSLELRTSPGRLADNRAFVRGIAEQLRREPRGALRSRPRVGVVFHFIKAPESRGDASPRARVFATRYGRWFREQWGLASGLGRMLEHHPELLLLVRGLDVAASELGIPNWPLVPIFARVRASAARAARTLARRRPQWGVEGLSTTLHLGEEFRRLVDGLRRVHEAVEHQLLRAGDRIGHGLVLGWDCRRWADANPCVLQSRDDRLDDLLWELDRYEARQLVDRGRAVSIRAEALRLVRVIYDGPIELEPVREARRGRFVAAWLRRLDYPRARPTMVPDRLALLHRYLTDPEHYRRGAALIEVEVDDAEVDFLERAQRWLCQQLALLGITIESNPTSNLIIGDFPDLRQHPTLKLSPLPGASAPDEGRLPISINTDDPITFATCLADEYAHMYYALIGQGVPTRDALAWLDQARDAGWRSRFTLDASADASALLALGRRRR